MPLYHKFAPLRMISHAFDFMQNVPLPHLLMRDIFYLRHLWVNHFRIKKFKNQRYCVLCLSQKYCKKGGDRSMFSVSTLHGHYSSLIAADHLLNVIGYLLGTKL